MQSQGYEVLERNFYCRDGEIDIICREGMYLVFVEVKYRKDTRLGSPEEAIQPYKMHRIVTCARHYLWKKGYYFDIPVRFDVVVILGTKIQIIKNAFEAG